jgi:hypothetical protein
MNPTELFVSFREEQSWKSLKAVQDMINEVYGFEPTARRKIINPANPEIPKKMVTMSFGVANHRRDTSGGIQTF